MRTRNESWLNTETMTEMYGVQAYRDGKWRNVAKDGKPAIFDNPADRDAFRAEIRKMKESTP